MAVDDIEDLVGSMSEAPGSEQEGSAAVSLHAKKPKNRKVLPRFGPQSKTNQALLENVEGQQEEGDGSTTVSFVPGRAVVYVKTWGCSHNSSDAEYMMGQMVAAGYPLTEDKDAADLWLLNSCTVKSPAEDHFRNFVNQGLDAGKKVVVSGCVPQGRPDAPYLKGLSVVGVQQIDRVVDVVEETLKGNSVRLFGQKKSQSGKAGGASLALPKVRRNPLIEIIAVNTGCLNQCTYCKTKHARGELGSYPIEDIVERAEQSFREGVVEIWLTSEDTGAYGRDIGVTLPDLLWELVKVIPEGCRLRLGRCNRISLV